MVAVSAPTPLRHGSSEFSMKRDSASADTILIDGNAWVATGAKRTPCVEAGNP